MFTKLLKNCLLDNIYKTHNIRTGVEASNEEIENGTYWPQRAHTMIGLKRLDNIEECFMEVLKNNIPGDLIETGVWRGGATIFMAGLNKYYKGGRRIFVADSFEGLPPPDPRYISDTGDKHYTYNNVLAVSLDEVKNNFKKYDLLDDNVIFIKGFFENSLKNTQIDRLSILRLDGDMYSSTIQVLDQLYDKVSDGGFIIVDDYSITGCKDAITDFRRDRNILSELKIVDWTGVYWIKEKINKEKGFIILRHVNSELTNKYWIYCYDCIRKYYPENSIMIVDDSSDYNFITNKELYKTTIINSEYSKRGELLPYYYYLKNKLFDIAVIIHDSVFINKYIDIDVDKYKIIWDFDHGCDQIEDETTMLKIFDDVVLLNFYQDKTKWSGCFGGMSIISYDFLKHINDKYDIGKLLPLVTSRFNRCSFERVIACLFQKEYKREVLLGDIINYCKWGIKFDEINDYKDLPLIKVWTGR